MSEEKKNIPPENDSSQKKPTLEEDIKIYEEAVSIDRRAGRCAQTCAARVAVSAACQKRKRGRTVRSAGTDHSICRASYGEKYLREVKNHGIGY